MQIDHTFTCRDCGREQTIRTDTADYGHLNGPYLAQGDHQYHDVDQVYVLPLRCPCGHVSGELGLGYVFGGTPVWP